MALIGQIRKKFSWILVVLIALGLGGFVLQDMLVGSSPASNFGSSDRYIGKVNGQKLDIMEFNRVESTVYNGTGTNIYDRRNSLWDFFVEREIVEQEANDLGLGVSNEELKSLQFGPNYSPIIVQNFPNPQFPGSPDVQQLQQLQQLIEGKQIDNAIQNGQLTPNFRSIWKHQEDLIIKDRLQTKLNTLVSKGMYTPTWMVEEMNKMQNQSISFSYVQVPFDEIENTEVSISDDDIRDYINRNKMLLEREKETRRLNYVVFNVVPTPQDSASYRKEITDIIGKFEAAENDTIFVQQYQGTFDGAYFKASELSPAIADTVFNIPIGSVYGPYLDAATYKAVKVVDRKVIPDSVEARHILLRVNSQAEAVTARTRIDSIKAAIESGSTTFEAMNNKYNTDVVAKADGGSLGYAAPGMMVKEFNDAIFFQAEGDELLVVATQFGLHLVQVTGRKFIENEAGVRLAYISKDIYPSDRTQKDRRNDAFTFMTTHRTLEALTQAVEEDPELNLELSNAVDENAYQLGLLGADQSSRDMIKWAFNKKTKIGNVAPNIYEYSDPIGYFQSKFVVVALKSIQEPGLPEVDEVRADIEQTVVNEKKGELIAEQIKGKSLQEVAQQFSTSVDTITSATFSSAFIQNVGSEPKLVGEAAKLEKGTVSEPIIGSNGVYLIRIAEKTIPSAVTNIPQLRTQFSSTARSQVPLQLMASLKENAKIKDNRSAFY